MFQTENSIISKDSSLFEFSEDNYILQINDLLEMNVYTNNGELLVDPNRDLAKAISSGNSRMMQNGANNKKEQYLVLSYPQIK